VTCLVALGLGSGVAHAHIDPDPSTGQAGARLDVSFTVEHGCDGSPTVQLDMRLPDGVTDPVPVPPDGWEASVQDGVVTFVGGPLPDDQPLAFPITMTLPPTPEVTIYFPFVQRCEVGEIRWIDIPTDGSGAVPDEPAPALTLTGPVVITTAVPPSTTSTTTSTTTSLPAPTTVVTAPPTTTAPVGSSSSAASPTSATTAVGSSSGPQRSGIAAAAIIGIAIAIGAGTVMVVRRRPR
jgi:uncharacterized protein YcnI